MDKIALWQEKLNKNFGNPNGGKELQILQKKEYEFKKNLEDKLKGHIPLIDAFFDLYLETFRFCGNRDKSVNYTPEQTVITLIHTTLLSRFRASFISFLNGYIIEASSLLRSALENNFHLLALKLRIITVDEIFGKLKKENSEHLSEEEIEKILQENNRKTLSKIKKHLRGQHSGLSQETCKSISNFIDLLNFSIHNPTLIQRHIYRIRGNLSIYPREDERINSIYLNGSACIAWTIVKTLPLLQIRDKEFSENWNNKLNILNSLIEEMVKDIPNPTARAFEELIEKNLIFNYFYLSILKKNTDN